MSWTWWRMHVCLSWNVVALNLWCLGTFLQTGWVEFEGQFSLAKFLGVVSLSWLNFLEVCWNWFDHMTGDNHIWWLGANQKLLEIAGFLFRWLVTSLDQYFWGCKTEWFKELNERLVVYNAFVQIYKDTYTYTINRYGNFIKCLKSINIIQWHEISVRKNASRKQYRIRSLQLQQHHEYMYAHCRPIIKNFFCWTHGSYIYSSPTNECPAENPAPIDRWCKPWFTFGGAWFRTSLISHAR